MKKVFWIALLLGAVMAGVAAPALRPEHPTTYTVRFGDTLWNIASQFLQEPWQWQGLWPKKGAPSNDDLYPGDQLILRYSKKGVPYLALQRTGTITLSPQVRSEPIKNVVVSIPFQNIQPFLTSTRIVGQHELDTAPYVIATTDERLAMGTGDKLYARGLTSNKQVLYTVYRREGKVIDPATKKLLGYEAMHVGNLELIRFGDPATLLIIDAKSQILPGDRLLPEDTVDQNTELTPQAPIKYIDGQIASVLGGVTQIGQYQVIVINRGQDAGLRVGDLLDIYHSGDATRDTYIMKRRWRNRLLVRPPAEKIGDVIVLRAFSGWSFALVANAEAPIHVADWVVSTGQTLQSLQIVQKV